MASYPQEETFPGVYPSHPFSLPTMRLCSTCNFPWLNFTFKQSSTVTLCALVFELPEFDIFRDI